MYGTVVTHCQAPMQVDIFELQLQNGSDSLAQVTDATLSIMMVGLMLPTLYILRTLLQDCVHVVTRSGMCQRKSLSTSARGSSCQCLYA